MARIKTEEEKVRPSYVKFLLLILHFFIFLVTIMGVLNVQRCKKYGIIFNLPECLLLYRQHSNQTSVKNVNLNLNTKLKKQLISEMISS